MSTGARELGQRRRSGHASAAGTERERDPRRGARMQTQQQPTEDRRGRSAETLAGELKKLSQQILWRNHRAATELKDAVRVVARELEQTADALTASAPGVAMATVRGHLALLEAKDKLTLLEGLVRNALCGAAHSPTFIGETARLELALAKMAASDLF